MDIKRLIATNIKELRKSQNLTQQGLAKRSGLPRSTIATIENGSTSPSVESLHRLGQCLSVSLDELIREPRPSTNLVRAAQIPKKQLANGNVTQHKLLPDPIYGMEIDRIELKSGARMRGVPHIADTREYFSCTQGEVEIYCDGEKYHLKKGDVLSFPGDRAHSYSNPGRTSASGFSVVVLAK